MKKVVKKVFKYESTAEAAKHGDLDELYEMTKAKKKDGSPRFEKHNFTVVNAAAGGHEDCLKFAIDQKFHYNWVAAYSAAKNGHLKCLQILHRSGVNWDCRTCEYAAYGGHLECLKFAHENGCDWDDKTIESAARNGHLECLKYAVENDCEFTGEAFYAAIVNGRKECFEYLLRKKTNVSEVKLKKIMSKTIDGDHPAITNYLLKNRLIEEKERLLFLVKDCLLL